MCAAIASASSPTDVGLAAKFANPAVRLTASRSWESDPPPAASAPAAHRADHAFASASRPPGSSLDDPPGTRSQVLPAIPKTTALPPLLRFPPPPDLLRQRRSLVLCSLHGPASSR